MSRPRIGGRSSETFRDSWALRFGGSAPATEDDTEVPSQGGDPTRMSVTICFRMRERR